MAMRDQIYEAIQAGGATTESLLELTGTTKKGLASQMTYLRMMGKCPMKGDDGVYKIVTPEEWAASRESSGTPGKILSPEERAEKAQKREQRATTALTNAEKKKDANPDDRLAELAYIKAEAELEISSILLGQAEEALRNAPAADVDEDDSFEAEDELE